MSRVRGPTSALTEFLRERGINNERLSMFRRNAEQQQAAAEAAAEALATGDLDTADAALAAVMQAGEQPNGEGSSSSAGNAVAGTSAQASSSASPARSSRPSTSRRRSRTAASLNYEEEDDTEEEEEEEEEAVAASTSRSRGRASTSSAKGQRAASTSKAAASKKQKKKHDDDDDDDDFVDWATGGVPGSSRSNHSYAGRTPGKIDYCAGCKAKFTITKYTKITDKGAFCHRCGPALASDAGSAPKPRKKRVTAAEKRQAQLEELKIKIPSLQSMCISIVSDHIEDVDALGDIGPHNIDAISKAIARSRSLNPNTLKLFLSPGLPELSLYDCSQLDGDALASFGAFAPDLEAINLQMCGRLVDPALDAWAQKLKKLRSLELFGPFLVRVEAWYRFFEAVGPRLRTFKIRETPRFDLSCVEKMVQLCPNITELGLAQIGKLDDKMLSPLAAYQNLTYLDVSDPGVSGPGIMAESLKDDSIIALLSKVGGTLQSLNISGNNGLTDAVVLKGIAPHCGLLTSLACSGCDQITGKAFARLWTGNVTGASLGTDKGADSSNGGASQFKKRGRPSKASQQASQQEESQSGQVDDSSSVQLAQTQLQRINLSRALQVDDDAIVALMQHSGGSLVEINLNSVDLLTERGLGAMVKHCKSVVTIDLSFCRALDDSHLIDLMKIPTLQKILVWGCNRVSDFVNHPRVAIVGKERSAVF
ncbi:UV-damaged DNA-binding protein rad7 [Tilletia horrida]|nr:UV-damaged DNA-binding protein rad7 [Tilletia horrida]